MFAYGIGGLLAGLFAMWGILKKAPKGWKDVIILAVFGFFGILLVVGPLLDTSTFFTVATSYDAASVLAVYLAGVPVNCVHGAAVALTMLLFGGSASVGGTVTGVFTVQFLNEILRSAERYQLLIYGILLLLVILAFPGGLYGLIKQVIAKIKSKKGEKANAAS